MSGLPAYKVPRPRLFNSEEILARHRQNQIDHAVEAYREYLITKSTRSIEFRNNITPDKYKRYVYFFCHCLWCLPLGAAVIGQSTLSPAPTIFSARLSDDPEDEY